MARAIIFALLCFFATTHAVSALTSSHDELRASIRSSLSESGAGIELTPAEYESLVEALVAKSIEKGLSAEDFERELQVNIEPVADSVQTCSETGRVWCTFFEKVGAYANEYWFFVLGGASALLAFLIVAMKGRLTV